MILDSAKKQIAINFSFTVIKAVSLLLSIRLADVYLSAAAMGLLLLFRRQGALWGNVLQLGFSQCIQKFYTENTNSLKRKILWITLNKWIIIASSIFIFISILFSRSLAEFLFGSSPNFFSWSFGVYTSGLALGFLACSSWLAEFRFIAANMIDWLNGSLIFIFCIILFARLSIEAIIPALSVLTLIVSVSVLLMFAFSHIKLSYFFDRRLKLESKVIKFGVTRSVSSFLDMGLLLIGPWMLKDNPQQAGYLLISFNVLRIAQTLIMPISQVLALRSNSYHYDQRAEIRNVLRFSCVSIIGGCIVIVGYFICGDWLISLWLPNSSRNVLMVLNKLIWFVPAFCLFYSLRNFIELRYLFPWNLVILSIALLGFIATYYYSTPHNIATVITSIQVMLSLLFILSFIFFNFLVVNHRRVM